MDALIFQCVACGQAALVIHMTYWRCSACRHIYPCANGIPRLYLENQIAAEDKFLRDRFYDGFLGRFYQFVMPFLTLPARPFRVSWLYWGAYCAILTALGWLAFHVLRLPHLDSWNGVDAIRLAAFLLLCVFLGRHRYVLFLLILAVPVKVSLLISAFRPRKAFAEVHADLIHRFLASKKRLRILDVCTGTCNSLYRHGWMRLDADYVGLDLSETMLRQGRWLMTQRQVPMDFVLGDTARLPFQPDVFDIVLNYGAVNGLADAKQALREMTRVAKPGGLVLFLDEQLYESASWVERCYFRWVLSSHNQLHHCPVELLPDDLHDVDVQQVYEFYYLCSAVKA